MKVLLFAGIVLVIAHIWPLAVAPVGSAVAVVLAAGSALLAAVLAIAGAGISVAVILLVALLLVVVALSPVWLPILAIIGLIALVRHSTGSGGVKFIVR